MALGESAIRVGDFGSHDRRQVRVRTRVVPRDVRVPPENRAACLNQRNGRKPESSEAETRFYTERKTQVSGFKKVNASKTAWRAIRHPRLFSGRPLSPSSVSSEHQPHAEDA